MKRPPRNLRQSIFNIKNVSLNLIQGLGVLAVTFGLFVYAVKSGRGESEARSFAFVSLVLSNLLLIAINLSWHKSLHRIILSANKIMLTVFIGTLLSLLAVLYMPFLADLFHLAPIGLRDFILIGFAMFASLLWFEILKFLKKDKLI